MRLGIRRDVLEQRPKAFGDTQVKIQGTSDSIRSRESGFLARRATPWIPTGKIFGDIWNSRRNLCGVYAGPCGIMWDSGYFCAACAQFKSEIDTPPTATTTHRRDGGARIGNIDLRRKNHIRRSPRLENS